MAKMAHKTLKSSILESVVGRRPYKHPLNLSSSKTCQPLGDLSNLEKFESFIQPPWLLTVPCIILPRDKAISFAQSLASQAIFTDSSARNGVIGIGIHSPNISSFPISSATIASTSTLNVFSGELLAIDVALAQLTHLLNTNSPGIHNPMTVFTDSQAALNALNFPALHSGQFLIKSIMLKYHQLKSQGILYTLQWSPGHSKIPVNGQAHELAQLATRPNSVPLPLTTRVLLYSIAKQTAHLRAPAPDLKTLFLKTRVGRFIKSFDKALPGKHSNTIYNGRPKKQSQILCQLRTGICRLNSYLAKIQAVDSDQCGCNRGSEIYRRPE